MNATADTDNKRLWREFLARKDLIGGQILFHPGKLTVAQIESVHDYVDYVTFRFSWSAAKTLRGWTRRFHKRFSLDKREIKFESGGTFELVGRRFIPAGHQQLISEDVVVEKTSHRS